MRPNFSFPHIHKGVSKFAPPRNRVSREVLHRELKKKPIDTNFDVFRAFYHYQKCILLNKITQVTLVSEISEYFMCAQAEKGPGKNISFLSSLCSAGVSVCVRHAKRKKNTIYSEWARRGSFKKLGKYSIFYWLKKIKFHNFKKLLFHAMYTQLWTSAGLFI